MLARDADGAGSLAATLLLRRWALGMSLRSQSSPVGAGISVELVPLITQGAIAHTAHRAFVDGPVPDRPGPFLPSVGRPWSGLGQATSQRQGAGCLHLCFRHDDAGSPFICQVAPQPLRRDKYAMLEADE